MGKEWSKFAFRHRMVAQPEFYRDIVKSARREAAVEMTQSGNDHSHDGDLDVGPRLIEDEEIEARTPGDFDAGIDLPACVVEKADRRAAAGWSAGLPLGVRNGCSRRCNGFVQSRLGFSPVPPPIRPIDRN